jgi:E3 ubiquitin-protein ligase TRIP12
MKHNNPNYHSKYSVTLKKTMRIKINVERDKIIEHGFNIINDDITSKFKGYLEFEYSGEIGNGLGPTLEFYTLIIDKIAENQDLWYKTTDGTLYPRLLCDKESDMNEHIIRLFKLLGYIIGRAIYDDRLLNIPLNKVFWNLVLDKPILFKNIKYIDSNLYKTILDFINLIKQKQEYIKTNNIDKTQNINFDDIILYNNCKLSELDIYFVFPGYNNIELKPNGNDILLTMNNIEEYVNLIYDFLFYRGIDKCMQSFRKGFNINFNIEKLKCFTSSEIEEYICGSVDTKWDRNILLENLKPEHGYTNQSKTFNDLITFMCSLDKKQRKQFLIFSTGSSRLPIGGFKSLSPKLTVVKKHCEEEHSPDDYLPTVMTCQNYLKIPEYSNYNILEHKILLAMNEGCNEFSLS